MIKHKVVLNPKSYRMAHPVYAKKDAERVKFTHKPPKGLGAKFCRNLIQLTRTCFDMVTRYDEKKMDKMDERMWMNRVIFLETIAGVPGMIGGM